jgi:hypothetical protein
MPKELTRTWFGEIAEQWLYGRRIISGKEQAFKMLISVKRRISFFLGERNKRKYSSHFLVPLSKLERDPSGYSLKIFFKNVVIGERNRIYNGARTFFVIILSKIGFSINFSGFFSGKENSTVLTPQKLLVFG